MKRFLEKYIFKMSKDKLNEVQEEPKAVEVEADADTTQVEVKVTKGKKKAAKKSTKKKQTKEEKLQEQIEQLTKEKDELNDKFLRQYAEFDNFRKRTNKERYDLIQTAASSTIASLLPVIDDFDRAIKAAEDDDNIEPLSEGVMLVYEKLKSILAQRGLKVMETKDKAFDPDFHEAVAEIPAATEEMKGKIIDTLEKGYTLHDKIIRHARVVVGK